MILTGSKTIFAIQKLMENIKIVFELTKFRLSALVSFSAVFGFLLASNEADLFKIFILFISGYLVSASSVINNQILEKDFDKLMDRTKNRPLPMGKISSKKSILISIIFMLVGLTLMGYFLNIYSAVISFLSLLLYSFIYTPLKRVGPIAVFVGAIPGALPPLGGWVAATNQIHLEGLMLFGILFCCIQLGYPL